MRAQSRGEREPAGPVLCSVLVACAACLLLLLCAGVLWRNWFG
jgi:hypothetical protein